MRVNGQAFEVEVAPSGAVGSITPAHAEDSHEGQAVPAPLAGNIFKIQVKPGQKVHQGDVILILEAMKMETEVRAPRDGTILHLSVKEGDSVAHDDPLLYIS